ADMRVEMGDIDAGAERALDLGASFDQCLLGSAVSVNVGHLVPHIAVGSDQARDLLPRGDRAPTILAPLGSMAKMYPKILLRMFLRVSSDLRKPWTGRHNGSGTHQSFFEAFDGPG